MSLSRRAYLGGAAAGTLSLVLPQPALYVREAAQLFDAQGSLVDARTRESLAAVLQAFARWIELLPNTRAATQAIAAGGNVAATA